MAHATGQTVGCGRDSLQRNSVESTTKINKQAQGPSLSSRSKLINKHELELINDAITSWDKKEKSIIWARRTAEIQNKVALARIMKQANKEAHTLNQALTGKTADQQKTEIDRWERTNTLLGSITPGGAIIGITNKWIQKITKKVTQHIKLRERVHLINKYGKRIDTYIATACNQLSPDPASTAQPIQNTCPLKGGYGGLKAHTYLQTNTNIKGTERAKNLQLRLAAAKIKYYMDPAGDGLCFWYCIAEAIYGPIHDIKTKIIRALKIQKEILQWMDTEYKRAAPGERTILHTATGTRTQDEFQRSIQHLRDHPHDWTSDIAEGTIALAARALRRNITIYTTSICTPNDPIRVHRFTTNGNIYHDNEEIRVFRDHIGSHYLLIHQMDDGWQVRHGTENIQYALAQDDKEQRAQEIDNLTDQQRAKINQRAHKQIQDTYIHTIGRQANEVIQIHQTHDIPWRPCSTTHTPRPQVKRKACTQAENEPEITATEPPHNKKRRITVQQRNYCTSTTGYPLYVNRAPKKNFGLYCAVDIVRGSAIDEYLGQVTQVPTRGKYVVHAGTKSNPIYINGDPTISPYYVNQIPIGCNGLARAAYINEPGTTEWANAKMVKIPNGIKIIAIRPIPAHAEITMCYGPDYNRNYPHDHCRSKCYEKTTLAASRVHELKVPKTTRTPKRPRDEQSEEGEWQTMPPPKHKRTTYRMNPAPTLKLSNTFGLLQEPNSTAEEKPQTKDDSRGPAPHTQPGQPKPVAKVKPDGTKKRRTTDPPNCTRMLQNRQIQTVRK